MDTVIRPISLNYNHRGFKYFALSQKHLYSKCGQKCSVHTNAYSYISSVSYWGEAWKEVMPELDSLIGQNYGIHLQCTNSTTDLAFDLN